MFRIYKDFYVSMCVACFPITYGGVDALKPEKFPFQIPFSTGKMDFKGTFSWKRLPITVQANCLS